MKLNKTVQTQQAGLVVEVTQRHIDNGKEFSTDGCPIAWALQEATGLPYHVGIGHYWLGVGERKKLPDEARQFVKMFDLDGPSAVQPFTLVLK